MEKKPQEQDSMSTDIQIFLSLLSIKLNTNSQSLGQKAKNLPLSHFNQL